MLNGKWRQRIGIAVVTYLALWGLTWVFGRSTVTRHFVEGWAGKRDAQDKPVFVEIREGSEFTGTGFDFRPAPIPKGYPWVCVGRPFVPAPFLICTDYAYLRAGLDGGAGRVYFLWTPWKPYWLETDVYWSA